MINIEKIETSNYDMNLNNEIIKSKSRTENPTVLPEGDGLVSKGMFIWPIPGYTKINSHFGMRVHPITRSL